MPNTQVGFISMPKIAGVPMRWRLQMAHATWRVHAWCSQRPSCMMVPLPPNLNILEKKNLHFLIVSILPSKLGNKLTFMLCPHLIPYLCRAKIVHWVSESKWPFQIVKDHGFQSLMKTGIPHSISGNSLP